jgi:hypothetical protein
MSLSHPPSFICLCLYFCLSLCPPSSVLAQASAGLPHFRQPPQVRIVGVLVAPEDKRRSTLQTLTVHVKGKTWKLRIRNIKALTATTNSGWGLLRELFPPKLRLLGADALLAPLQQDDIAGKLLELEGRLYVGAHQLVLSTVKVTEAE